jgi:sporulation protein YlmC with PRC-barrel domain
MRAHHFLLSTAITLGLSVSGLSTMALAQQQTQNQGRNVQNQSQQAGQGEKVDVVAWSEEQNFDNGWTAEQMMGTEVQGQNGEDIGEIENLIVGAGGQIQKVVVEAGGVWDIGDTHLAVPWKQVQVGQNLQRVTAPISEENVEDFSLFDEEEAQSGERAWRATELMNDYVSLQGYRGYGVVQDLLFSKDGQLSAVIVYPDVGYGVGAPYAYPYHGYDYGFDPGSDYYQLPYTRNEIAELGPFDYSAFQTEPGTQDQQQLQGQG